MKLSIEPQHEDAIRAEVEGYGCKVVSVDGDVMTVEGDREMIMEALIDLQGAAIPMEDTK